ncbi:MAG: hypothetical protein R3C01_05860 [Planctomycetaceae bacterium]
MCLAIGAAGFAIDAWVVTEREQVEAQIISLVRDFESGDQHRTLAHFSELAIVERLMVGAGMNLVSVAHPLSLKDFSIELSHEDSVATTRFRANGEVLVNGRSVGHQATFWELRWRKEADAWKVIAVQELDPIRGTPQNRAATFTAK